MIQGRDIVVLICLSTRGDHDWTVRSLASELGLAAAGVQRSIKNLESAGLMFNPPDRNFKPQVLRENAASFLIHAVHPYFPPVYLGDNVRGVAAASFASPLREMTSKAGETVSPLVWPYALGEDLGTAIQPLHESVPRIALAHPEPGGAGELLALVDAIRYRTWTRNHSIAADLITKGFALPSVSHDERRTA
jgi:hypothetical protein